MELLIILLIFAVLWPDDTKSFIGGFIKGVLLVILILFIIGVFGAIFG